jgi:hypothetical protein
MGPALEYRSGGAFTAIINGIVYERLDAERERALVVRRRYGSVMNAYYTR